MNIDLKSLKMTRIEDSDDRERQKDLVERGKRFLWPEIKNNQKKSYFEKSAILHSLTRQY